MTRIPSGRDEHFSQIPAMIGSSPALTRMQRIIRQVAKVNASVLLLGETGTGKELVAKEIHRLSPRGSGAFVRVNCGALPDNQVASGLLAQVRSAFNIANNHVGTIFLGDLNLTTSRVQIELLRVLQEQQLHGLMSVESTRLDARLIAASSRDLHQAVAAGQFCEELYYRLDMVTIYLPPLRERREDIPLLVTHFLRINNEQNLPRVLHVQPKAMEMFCNYAWPGNTAYAWIY